MEELGWSELRTLWTAGKTVTPRAVEIQTAGAQGAIPQRLSGLSPTPSKKAGLTVCSCFGGQ